MEKECKKLILLCVGIICILLVPRDVSAASKSNNWVWPTYVHTFKSDWPNYASGSYHGGTDFPVALNTNVYSSCEGDVVSVKYLTTSYGKHIKIRAKVNEQVVYIRYCHLNEILVNEGQHIMAGQIIGRSGSTGNSTGPHLHYEVRNSADSYRNALNPRLYLPGTSYTYESSEPTVNDPIGYLDSYSGEEGGFNISGWARDDDEPDTGIEIHVYIGGPAGSAETEGHSGVYANQYRSDVGNHGYSATIKTNRTGRQDIYIYAINVGGGNNVLIGTGAVTITPNEAPKISNVRVEDLSSSGYTVKCDVTDNTGVSSVSFPTWTRTNGQDDIKWHEGSISGNTAECRIDIKDHNNETNCFYATHIYVYDIVGNLAATKMEEYIYVDSTPPVVSGIKITNVNETGFDVSFKIWDNYGIDRIKCPTWTRKNWQDDLLEDWSSNSIYDGKIEGDMFYYHVDTKDHNNETGVYFVHVYVYDKCGNLTVVPLNIQVGKTELKPVSTTTYNGHLYMLFERTSNEGGSADRMKWPKVASYCQSLGGTLACITSAEENAAVASIISEYGKPCWIGGNALENSGQFVWESGEPFSYTSWDPGEPNNVGGNQKFIRMYPCGTWDDCEEAGFEGNGYAFICEFDNMISTITYHLDGGENNTDNPDYYYVDNPYVKLSDPSKEGYLFDGWYLSEHGDEVVTEETRLQGDVDLYARWIKDSVPKLSVQWDDEMVVAIVSNMDSAKSYGFVYGKGTDVTLETPGRTRIAYSEIDSNKRYSFDTSGLTGCTIRAYVVYTDQNGTSQIIYSDPIER